MGLNAHITVLLAAVSMVIPSLALSDAYRLVSGDTVDLILVGAPDPLRATVDVDGNLRLYQLGAVPVVGLTLDEVEKTIEAALAAAAIYNNPAASVSIASYAPVIVAGDVRAPGRVDYIPGLTVTAALGIAGGAAASGTDQFSIEQARVETASRIRQANLDIAAHVATILRLDAMIKKRTSIASDAPLVSVIPAQRAVDFARILRDQTEILEAENSRYAELFALWEKEIEAATQQIALFEARIILQEELVARNQRELAEIRKLEEQGLATAVRVLTSETRATDAQSRLLEIETAQINAEQVLSEALRARAAFDARLSNDLVEQLSAERIALDRALLAYARHIEMQTLLSGNVAADLVAEKLISVEYRRINPQLASGEGEGEVIGPNAPLRPGDTLIVTVSATPVLQDDS